MYTFIKRIIFHEYVTVLVVALTLLILTVFMHYFILPELIKGNILKNYADQYELLVNTRDEYTELKRHLSEKSDSLETKYLVLTKGMGDPSDISSLLQQIFDKAFNAGVTLEKTIPQQEVIQDEYICYPVVVDVTASYQMIGEFIKSLEILPQLFRVDRLALTANGDSKIKGHLLITCYLAKGEQ